MKIEIGDVVKFKEGITTRVSGGEVVFISVHEIFSVVDILECSVRIKTIERRFGLQVSKSLVEVGVKRESPPKKTSGKTNLNEGKGKMPKGTVVKIGVNELADAHEWLRTNGCDIKLNSNEHFTVDIETTKMVFIYSKDKVEVICLPKRFLEEVTPEQIKLNEQDVLALIDIAIDTGDEEWFNELHSKLSALA